MNNFEQLTYTIAEGAQVYGCCYATLWRAIRRGDVKVLAGAGRLRVSKAELERFASKSVDYTPRRKAQKEETVTA